VQEVNAQSEVVGQRICDMGRGRVGSGRKMQELKTLRWDGQLISLRTRACMDGAG
jgi:hypothetical protein